MLIHRFNIYDCVQPYRFVSIFDTVFHEVNKQTYTIELSNIVVSICLKGYIRYISKYRGTMYGTIYS